MQRALYFFIFVLSGTLITPLFASEASCKELFELINQRLSYMKDVAAYKWENDKPIEDRTREVIVLQKSIDKAKQENLDPNSVEAFFVAQITVAKNIQTAWHTEWKETGLPKTLHFKDLADVRTELVSLGNEILIHITPALSTLHNKAESTTLSELFDTTVTTEKTTEEDKLLILNGLTQIQQATARDEL